MLEIEPFFNDLLSRDKAVAGHNFTMVSQTVSLE